MGGLKLEEIQFCIRCGTPLQYTTKRGDIRPNCPACGWIYFPDPKVAVAVLVTNDRDELLFVRRVNTPRRGYWTLPVGFVDAGEDPPCAAERECFEETGMQVQVTDLIDVIGVKEHPNGADILIVYCAVIIGGDMQAGDDAGEVGFFNRDDLPPLAFKSTQEIITHHFC